MSNESEEENSATQFLLAGCPHFVEFLGAWVLELGQLVVEPLVNLGNTVCLLVAIFEVSMAPA